MSKWNVCFVKFPVGWCFVSFFFKFFFFHSTIIFNFIKNELSHHSGSCCFFDHASAKYLRKFSPCFQTQRWQNFCQAANWKGIRYFFFQTILFILTLPRSWKSSTSPYFIYGEGRCKKTKWSTQAYNWSLAQGKGNKPCAWALTLHIHPLFSNSCQIW